MPDKIPKRSSVLVNKCIEVRQGNYLGLAADRKIHLTHISLASLFGDLDPASDQGIHCLLIGISIKK